MTTLESPRELPTARAAPSRVMRDNWVAFVTTVRKEVKRVARIWPQTILPPVITTALYFVIFGPVLGDRIGVMAGFTYLQYVTPGLIMMAIITNSYQNTSSSFFGAKFQHHVEEMLVSPMSHATILLGYTVGGALRGLVVGAIVTGTSLFFADLRIHSVAITTLVAVLTAVSFSLAGFVNAMIARTFDDVAIVPTFVLTPLTMLGGVFYSVSLLPDFWEKVSYANPILYMVNGFRHGILGTSDIALLHSFLILAIFTVAFFALGLYLLGRGVGIRS